MLFREERLRKAAFRIQQVTSRASSIAALSQEVGLTRSTRVARYIHP